MNSGSEYYNAEESKIELSQEEIDFLMVQHAFVEKMFEFGLEHTSPFRMAVDYYKELHLSENQDQG